MILLFILLMAGTVEAGEWEEVNGASWRFKDCFSQYDQTGKLLSRHGSECKRLTKVQSCYQKMQEAMKAADSYLLNPPPYMPPKTVEEREERYRIRKQVGEQWDQTMKECVR